MKERFGAQALLTWVPRHEKDWGAFDFLQGVLTLGFCLYTARKKVFIGAYSSFSNISIGSYVEIWQTELRALGW